MNGNGTLRALALFLLTATAPLAFAKPTSTCGATLAAASLDGAAKAWATTLAAFSEAPNDEKTRTNYAPYAPYQSLFLAHAAFRSATEDLAAIRKWPKGDREAAQREGLVDELSAKVEQTRATFEAEWQFSARRFLDSALAHDSGQRAEDAAPIRLAFSDREVAAFFARCRGAEGSVAQSCAGNVSWSKYARTALRRLELVNAATSLDDIRLRTKDLKRYNGGARYAGYFAIEIDHQWRLLFHWDFETGTAIDVFIDDYHNE